ncbi:hypothetical protein BGZ94_001075 [Podila epigama]|nr:hypothetical protein BGZ94_001075 [Podila epigama]
MSTSRNPTVTGADSAVQRTNGAQPSYLLERTEQRHSSQTQDPSLLFQGDVEDDQDIAEQNNVTTEWPIESQKVKDEQIQAFYREYAKRITAALTQYANQDRDGSAGLPEDDLANGKEYAFSPSPEKLLELYATLLRDNKDTAIRDALLGKTLSTNSLQRPSQVPNPCGCGTNHGLNFPDSDFDEELDNMDDEDEEDDDDEDYDDEDDDDEDFDDEDDEDEDEEEEEDEEVGVEDGCEEEEEEFEEGSMELYGDEDDDLEQDMDSELECDVIDGYAHHYENASPELLAHEEEMRRLDTIRKVREEELRLKEVIKAKQTLEKQRLREEQDRIEQLEKKRLEEEDQKRRDEEARLRKEKQEEEARKKRNIAIADQNARSFMFSCVHMSDKNTLVKMIETSPKDSASVAGILPFSSATVTRLSGWEYVTHVEGVGTVGVEKGFRETLLHIAVRNESLDIVTYLIEKGAPLDALDCDGKMPIHVAAENLTSLPICKLLVEKAAHHIDRTTASSGKTALHYAAMQGYADLVELLLANHARINIADLEGNTPESLAKAGLEEAMAEKSSKKIPKNTANAKIQRFRLSLQHLHKAMASIREAQIRRDAQIEEQRRKEEALAREEEEKDRAARRKQEEKLEAELRRQQEQEKELEKLKALVNDSHGQGGGGGSKKKKKKKGKGVVGEQQQQQQQQQQTSKDTLSNTANNSTTPTSSELSAPSAPSGGSPATASKHDTTLSKLNTSTDSGTQGALTASTSRSTWKTGSIPTSVSSQRPESNAASSTSNMSSSTPPSTASTSARLPKAKTTYRPSPSVILRMEDMGFPSRVSRKALIMTEGKVEEAIDLLTSGASLADDSEDEAEREAEAQRAKAAKKKAVATTASEQLERPDVPRDQKKLDTRTIPIQPPGTMRSPLSTSTASAAASISNATTKSPSVPVSTPEITSTTSKSSKPLSSTTRPTSQKAVGKSAQSSAQVQSNVLANKSTVPLVQILQRTHPMAAHVHMRSVPTQVLQHANPSEVSGSLRRSFSIEERKSQAPNPAPFVPPPPVQRRPPTRAPYSYGAKQVTETFEPPTAMLPQTALSQTAPEPVHPLQSTPVRSTMESGSESAYALPKDVTTEINNFESPSAHQATNLASAVAYSGFASEQSNWGAGTASSGRMSSYPSSPHVATSPSLPWLPSGSGMSSKSHSDLDFGFGDSLGPMASPYAANISIDSSRSTFSAIGSSRAFSGIYSGGLQGYNPAGLEQPDVDIIKDVLAMTGVIDSDDFVEGLDNDYSLRGSSPADTMNASPSPATSRVVGGDRTQPHPTASLWSGDSFVGLVSSNDQPLVHSRLASDSTFGDGLYVGTSTVTRDSTTFNQWSSGYTQEATMYASLQQQHTNGLSFVESILDEMNNYGTSGKYSNSTISDGPTEPMSVGQQQQIPLPRELRSGHPTQLVQNVQAAPSNPSNAKDVTGIESTPTVVHAQSSSTSPSSTRLSPTERYSRLNHGGSQSYFDV